MQVKGLEAGMHEPRVKYALGLGFMVDPHGADHCCNMHDTLFETPAQQEKFRTLGITDHFKVNEIGPRKVAAFKLMQQERIFDDSAVLCMFLPYSVQQKADLMAAVTGWKTSVMELMKIAERTLTVARLFNIREGFGVDDDMLPDRFFQPKTDGILSDKPLKLDEYKRARSYYYSLMGWDENTGVPKPEKLEELGIA
jgi:aldehyde:ferredoxin oxidoreductase